MRLLLCISLVFVACSSGDAQSDGGGVDAVADAPMADATSEMAPSQDGGADAPSDGSANDVESLGDSMPLGDGACSTPPFASLTSKCGTTSASCLAQQGIVCIADAAACTSIDGYNTGRVAECGTPSDCGGRQCCLDYTISFTPGCPNEASFGADTKITTCAPTDAGCATPRICRTSAECTDLKKPCSDTVFDLGGDGGQLVHFGICW